MTEQVQRISECSPLIKIGDLLEATDDAIVQQCNCVTNKPHGLSSAVFKKYPEADCYSIRKPNERGSPGKTISTLCRDGKWVINLLGQYYPSKSKYPNDTKAMRAAWFNDGLNCIEKTFVKTGKIKSIGFPYQIGCGLAGGDWDLYCGMIHGFAAKHPNLKVTIYHLPEFANKNG